MESKHAQMRLLFAVRMSILETLDLVHQQLLSQLASLAIVFFTFNPDDRDGKANTLAF
jgi:hypothetical protein